MNNKELNLGAWYSIEFGFSRMCFCIVDKNETLLELETLAWLYSSNLVISVSDFFSAIRDYNPIFLGYGKYRPIMAWFRKKGSPWGSCYTKAKNWHKKMTIVKFSRMHETKNHMDI